MGHSEPPPPVDERFSVAATPADLKDRYDQMAVISHRRHLDRIAADGTLIISTDWLAYREAMAQGRPCLHIEHALASWSGGGGDPNCDHLDAGDWCYLDGRDATLFDGVPLGALFTRSIAMFDAAVVRLWSGLDRLVTRFRPLQLELFGFRGDFDLFPEDLQRLLVADVARRHGLVLLDRLDPVIDDANQVELPIGLSSPSEEDPWRLRLRSLYSAVVGYLFKLRTLLSGRRHVLVLHNWVTMSPLLDGYAGGRVAPMAIAGLLPKSPRFLWDCYRRGIVLAHLPGASLSGAEERALAAMVKGFEVAWTVKGDIFTEARRSFIKTNIFATGWLCKAAVGVKRYQRLFRSNRSVARVVVGDITNMDIRLVAEAARCNGVPTDELPNGMFLTGQRYDARCGDGRRPPVLARLLAWGGAGESWARRACGDIPVVCTGYPALDGLRSLSSARPVAPPSRESHILVLPIYVDCDDSIGLRANILAYLLDTVTALTEAGYSNIRVKIHPALPNPRYYTEVLRREGLRCPLVWEGGLASQLEWADLVVGPPNSGSFVEAMAAGRPYYAMCGRPSLVDQELIAPGIVVESGRHLVKVLDAGIVPDQAAVLERQCSFISIPNASKRFWDLFDAESQN